MEQDFEFPALINAMAELAQRSLATLVPVFAGIFVLGMATDYYLGDQVWTGLVVAICNFVISYFLVLGLARDSGLLEEGHSGPGFGAYFGVSFLMGLGTSLGFLLLVIPGIVLTVRWLLAFPILFSPDNYVEGRGALGQSWDITGKVAWKLFAAWLFGLVLVVITLYAYATWSYEPDMTPNLIGLAVANAAAAANTIYTLVLGFGAFLLLRNDSAELERIFS